MKRVSLNETISPLSRLRRRPVKLECASMESSILVKAFKLIEALADREDEAGLADLAQQATLAKPTAHRVLRALCEMGYVDRGETGQYRLGQNLVRIVLGRQHQRLLAAARPVVTRVNQLTQETVNLGVLQHGRVVYLYVLEGTHPLRRVATPHESHPFYCTALGRAIAAQLPETQREALVSATEVVPMTSNSVNTSAKLRQILQETQKHGYAFEDGETDIGVTCIAAPIFDGPEVVAGISVSMPTARLDAADRRETYAMIKDAAARISTTLQQQRGTK